MTTAHQCQARQYSDQMCCGKCGLEWDVNDPEPPACKPEDTKPKRTTKPRHTHKESNRVR
jgi:hypothetical protein